MTYVEGGKFYGVSLTAAQCVSIGDRITEMGMMLTFSSIACAAISLIPGLQAAVAGAAYFGRLATIASVSGWFFSCAAKRGGAYIGYDSTSKKFVYGYGQR